MGQSQYTPTKRGNPCQICGNDTGKCRDTQPTRLCMTYTDDRSNVPGFRFIGLTTDNLWGKWVEDKSYEWRQQQQQSTEQRQREESQQQAEAMPAIQRDRYYRQLLDSLPLHPADQADLQRRGLTDEQIQAGSFKSVKQWQKLDFELPYNLPGVNLNGRSLNVSSAGYLCPIRDADNLIVGCQLRIREATSGGRYRWLSSKTKKRPNGAKPHLPNGELPLAVFRQLNQETAAIALVEGTGAKPFILSQRLGLTTIGAAGGQFASSPEQLRQLTQQRTILFFPDAGAVQNDKVLRQYREAWKLLQEWDCSIQIAWWGQLQKGTHPDIDELETLESIRYLSVQEFMEMAKQNGYQEEEDFRVAARKHREAFDTWLTEHLLPAYQKLPIPEQYTGVKNLASNSDGSWVGRSPWAAKDDDTDRSFTILPDGSWHCSKRNNSGNIRDFLSLTWYGEKWLPDSDLLELCGNLAVHLEIPTPDEIQTADRTYREAKRKERAKEKGKSTESNGKGHPIVLDYQTIQKALGDRLRFNTLKQQVELDGKAINLDTVLVDLLVDHSLSLESKGQESIAQIVLKIAHNNEFNPVAEYLEACYQQYGDATEILNGIANRYFGIEHPIYERFFSRFLISAVARVFQPGCKVDSVLILQGKQGYQKSSFFRELAGADWFDDSFGNSSDKDERLKLHNSWLIEWAELERILKRRESGDTKSFITSQVDHLRPPYGRSVQAFPRRSILVGSSNEDEFLNDATGNRRFWVIPTKQRIPISLLQQERDRIWAAAVALYKKGEQWWLTPQEEIAATKVAQRYQTIDPWLTTIAGYVEGRDLVTTREILEVGLGVEISKQTKREEMRVSDILKQLKWQKTIRKINGFRQKAWHHPPGEDTQEETPPEPPDLEVVSEVVNVQSTDKSGFEARDTTYHHLNQQKKIEDEFTPEKRAALSHLVFPTQTACTAEDLLPNQVVSGGVSAQNPCDTNNSGGHHLPSEVGSGVVSLDQGGDTLSPFSVGDWVQTPNGEGKVIECQQGSDWFRVSGDLFVQWYRTEQLTKLGNAPSNLQ